MFATPFAVFLELDFALYFFLIFARPVVLVFTNRALELE